MRNDIPSETLDAIAALGFDVYQSSDPRWRSYAFFVEGDGIGYIENSAGLTLSTVHIPNRTTGTGYGLRDTLGAFELTRQYLSLAFMHSPAWASAEMRKSVAKWPSVDAFLKERGAGRFFLVRSAITDENKYRRGRSDYDVIRGLAVNPLQVAAQVTQEETDEMLGCVPPIYVADVPGFLVGEALTGDWRGTVYANYFTSRDGVPCARYHLIAEEA